MHPLNEFVSRKAQKAESYDAERTVRERIEQFIQRRNDVIADAKVDGCRVFAISSPSRKVLLATKHGGLYGPQDLPELFPLDIDQNTVLDCELLIKRQLLYVFDIVSLLGEDLTTRPLYRRKQMLEALFDPTPRVKRVMSQRFDGNAYNIEKFYEQCLAAGFEGVVLKDSLAPYGAPGSWLKLKQFETIDAVVIEGKPTDSTARTGELRCWKMGLYEPGGSLRHVCDVSSAIVSVDIAAIRPGTVLEVRYQPSPNFKSLRHPTIVRIRNDKTPQECTTEQGDFRAPEGEQVTLGGSGIQWL